MTEGLSPLSSDPLPTSRPDDPQLEFVMRVSLRFTRVQNIATTPTGSGRGAVYIDEGTFAGPALRGRVVPNSGGDYAMFRPDGVLSFDARYMLEEESGALILLHNRGYLWGRKPDTMDRIRSWIFDGGPPVDFDDYYLRAFPTFEVAEGELDWLMRYVFVGVGERRADGNVISYYRVL